MHADSFFRMGATHAVCQDYATAGRQAGGATYALLSDGCSGSPSSDWGARFLVRAAEQRAAQLALGVFDCDGLITSAERMSMACELPRSCLDATLIAAIGWGGFVQAFQAGDGIVAARARGGGFSYWATDCSRGAPLYLSYLLSRAARSAFDALDQTERVRNGTRHEETIQVRQPAMVNTYGFAASRYDLVLLLSDGADSFITKAGQHVPLPDVLEQVFDFKNYAGQFIARRCSRFLTALCAERGWRHEDDFSVAGIYLGDES